jgi:hypothetical protein
MSFSLLTRRSRWGLSWRGWALVFVLVGIGGWLGITRIHGFLAITDPVEADYLVVEGWVADYALEAAARQYREGAYSRLFTTGGPLAKGHYLAEHQTHAELAAAVLRHMDFIPDQLVAVPTAVRGRNRTYHSAVALRDWFREQGLEVIGLNVITVGTHARRTRLHYRRAFGPEVRIGIIAVPDEDYDPQRWWQSSEGAKAVISECVGLAVEVRSKK